MDIEPKHGVPATMGDVRRVYRVARSARVTTAFLVCTIAYFLGWLGAEYLAARAEGRELLQGPLRLVMAIAAGAALVWQVQEFVRGVVARVWLTEAGIHVQDLRTSVSVRWSEVESVKVDVFRSSAVRTLTFASADASLRLPDDLEHILELVSESRDRGLVADQVLPQSVLAALDQMTTTPPSSHTR